MQISGFSLVLFGGKQHSPVPPVKNSAKLHHLAPSGLLLLSPKLALPLGTTWLSLGRAFVLYEAIGRKVFAAFRLQIC